MLQVVWMKPCIMSSPWLENRRSRLCLLWAERLSDDASTNSCLSAWLGFLTFPELRLDSAILKIETLLISYLIKWLFFCSEPLQPTGVSYWRSQEGLQRYGVSSRTGADWGSSEKWKEGPTPNGSLPEPFCCLRCLFLLYFLRTHLRGQWKGVW